MTDYGGFKHGRMQLFIVVVLAMGLAAATAWHFSGASKKRSRASTAGGAVNILDHTNFEAGIASGVHLVDFWADWCGPCKIQDPIIKKVALSYSGRVSVAKIDVDANLGLASALQIQSIPTLMIFRDGKLVKRLGGLHSEAELSRELDDVLR